MAKMHRELQRDYRPCSNCHGYFPERRMGYGPDYFDGLVCKHCLDRAYGIDDR